MKVKYVILAILLLGSVLQVAYYYPRLPNRVASHFGAAGQADDWSSKTFFAAFQLGLTAFLMFLFVILPILLIRLPASMVNLPHKEYWLAPERRGQTNKMICSQMLSYGIATLLFLLGVFQLALQANLSESHQLSNWYFLGFLGGFLAFTLIWAIRFYLKFTKVPPSISDSNERVKTI